MAAMVETSSASLANRERQLSLQAETIHREESLFFSSIWSPHQLSKKNGAI
jgi:hypothetical protein